ncbi:AraC family transcriptional regulator [Aliishimia ponticola]|uniref:AraC family transcriptional regulator n=1 Tax=Aliishimia ponticola TaxID=2499833 RepID=A0A4S4NQB9_9RHOB|nr:helix-turn-helix transcriptional regulator [Aliishimia ponticola]THH38380.1 AraC family transcriptional regulator [Aliishimia ponticola]
MNYSNSCPVAMQTQPEYDPPHVTSLAQSLRIAQWRMCLLHSAPQHRLIWLTQGQGRALIDTRRRGIGAHNLIFLPAGHLFALDAGPPPMGHILSVPPGHAGNWPVWPSLARALDVREQGEITALFDAMSREQSMQRSGWADAMGALSQLMAVWLIRVNEGHLLADGSGAPLKDAATHDTAADRLIGAFLSDLERLYPQGAPMASYAERLDVTATHLSRVCKARLGRSASELIVERTLHAARDRLETTSTPVKDIAAGLGFRSAAYFSRFIQSHTGNSPRALRKRAREATERARQTAAS